MNVIIVLAPGTDGVMAMRSLARLGLATPRHTASMGTITGTCADDFDLARFVAVEGVLSAETVSEDPRAEVETLLAAMTSHFEEDLAALRARYVGKDGELTHVLRRLAQLSPQDRREFGERLNVFVSRVRGLGQ